MEPIVIQIPRLNDYPSDFRWLFQTWNELDGFDLDVRFDFSRCGFLRPNAVAFLGGLARRIESRNGKVIFDWSTLRDSWIRTTIRQNGFAASFGDSSAPWDGNSIPYREDTHVDMNTIMDYLTYNWIGKGWVHVSERLKNAIAGRMWEIYSNAFEHSGTKLGVFSCGQHYPTQNILLLSVVDFGQGIPSKIRNFAGDDPRAKNLGADTCLRWAFTRGKSTETEEGVARGLGLDLLKEFVKLNGGKLEVYSNEGYVEISNKGETFKNLSDSFEGTIVHVTLQCDENLYQLSDETEPQF